MDKVTFIGGFFSATLSIWGFLKRKWIAENYMNIDVRARKDYTSDNRDVTSTLIGWSVFYL